jgi:hypothetical protein
MKEVSRSGITGELQLSALIADLWWRVDLMNFESSSKRFELAFLIRANRRTRCSR